MKIRSVRHNNRKRSFQVRLPGRTLASPYSKAKPAPGLRDPVVRVFVDEDLGREGFGYELESGRAGTVHIERV